MTRKGMFRLTIPVLLALSLAGNFFALGFFAHQWRSGTGAFTALLETRYPADVRTAFRSRLRDNGEPLKAALADLRAARKMQEALSRQSPLDEAALRAAMEEVRIKTTALQSLTQDYLVAAIKDAENRHDGQ
ncbi:periplasmic heavy metal sensor [Rhizobium sp. FY34]|uniref:periplasmic heavy metal sensor n=1 Tax=Rhizobium sp. FY34 TaxID=2562309 RepID=UPI0010BF6926|nr:periplasmic heavy metal sensor [Rhizobium sp. FY34]